MWRINYSFSDVIVSSSEAFFWGSRILRWKIYEEIFFVWEISLVDWIIKDFFFFFVSCLFSQMVPRIHHKDRGGSCPTTSERRKLFGEEQRIDQTRLFFIVKVSGYLDWWFFFLCNFIYFLTRYLIKQLRNSLNFKNYSRLCKLHIYIKKKLFCLFFSFFINKVSDKLNSDEKFKLLQKFGINI